MKVQLTLADPILLVGSIYMANASSSWWLLVIPLLVCGWFINPRWNKEQGFRFWR